MNSPEAHSNKIRRPSKILALLLVIIMAVGLLPTQVFADELTATEKTTPETTSSENNAVSEKTKAENEATSDNSAEKTTAAKEATEDNTAEKTTVTKEATSNVAKTSATLEDENQMPANTLWVDSAFDTTYENIVKWYYKSSEGKYYLFVPSSLDLSYLRVHYNFEGVDSITINGITLFNGQITSELRYLNMDNTIKAGGKTYTVRVMKSDLPAMFVNTDSGSMDAVHADKAHKEPGTMLLQEKNGDVVTDTSGALEYIKGRGNSSWEAAQKIFNKYPYNIKLSKKTSLLGMGKAKKWSLLADDFDQSLLRNKIVFDLAEETYIQYTGQCEKIDLYTNGDYVGTYTIAESVEVGDTRVAVRDLEGDTEDINDQNLDSYPRGGSTSGAYSGTNKYFEIPNNPEDITGGYLMEFEMDTRYPNELSGFVTNKGQPIVLGSPEAASKEQVAYISSYFQKAEDAVYSSTGYNAEGKHYTEYLDITSAAKAYLIQEWSMNVDAVDSSFFMYKDSNDVIRFGPVWDFDWSMGGYNRADLLNFENLYVQNKNIYNRANLNFMAQLCKSDEFMQEVIKVWNEDFRPALKVLLGNSDEPTTKIQSLTDYYNGVKSSATMNFKRWNFLGDTSWTSADTGHTYDENISYVRNFVTKRTNFLNSYIDKISSSREIYFDNNVSKWSNVYAYMWTEGSSVAAKVVQATEVNEGSGIYSVDVNGQYENIIFKNTESTWQLQTADLTIPAGSKNCYKPTGTSTKPAGYWYEYDDPHADLSIKSFTTDLVSPQPIGKNVVINALAVGGDKNYQYEISINSEVVSNTKTYTWSPAEIGHYKLSVTVTDGTGATATKEIDYTIKEKSQNITKVYYKNTSYVSSFMHYRIGSGKWTVSPGVKMESSSSMPGYTELTIDLEEDTSITACFNNGSGAWDSNGGKNYTFGVGSFTLENGVITDITDRELEISSFTASKEGSQYIGKPVTLTANTQYGQGTAYYKFIAIKDGVETVIQDYSEANSTEWTPDEVGNYILTVYATDALGKEVSKTMHYVIKDVSQNTTTVYYKNSSYGSAYFHYRLGSGAWTTSPGVKMESSSTMPGYFEITVDMDEETVLTACPNNGSGAWDNNGGKNYTFGVGKYKLENGVITDITEHDLEIASFTASKEGSQTIGKPVTLTATTKYGEGTKNYKFTVTKDGIENIIQDYSTSNSVDWTATEIGNYVLTVYATDDAGTEVSKTMNYTIKDVSQNTTTVYYKNSSYGGAYFHYRVGNGTWTVAPGVKMESSSTMPGYYEISIEMEDETMLTACPNNGSGAWDNNGGKNYTFSVGRYTLENGVITDITDKPLELASFTASKDSSQYLGKPVTLTAQAQYGEGSYQYKFTATKDGEETTIQDYSTANSVEWTATEAGAYTLKVYIKDSDNNTAQGSMAYTIIPISENNVTIYYNVYTNPYIHYQIGSGTWTTVPGVAMTAVSGKPGYYELTVDLNDADTLTACFNNGYGVWDSNGGRNYTFTKGTWEYSNGKFIQIS